MVGHPNVDKMVYDVFNKVMAQVEGGSLIVQKGREGKRRGSDSRNQKRDFNICEGLDEALNLAKAITPKSRISLTDLGKRSRTPAYSSRGNRRPHITNPHLSYPSIHPTDYL